MILRIGGWQIGNRDDLEYGHALVRDHELLPAVFNLPQEHEQFRLQGAVGYCAQSDDSSGL
jgi:hypothetical protein